MDDYKTLIKLVSEYNKDELDKIKKAYKYASIAHANQLRESMEPYIIHPVNVCINLTKFHADGATLVAGMLHDVVEDTKFTIEDIKKEFGDEVAHLVLGVTKINNLHFSSLDEARDANIRRIVTSLNDDVRIIIIKLCDRLHNMQTLKYKKQEKQQKSSLETLSIYVPLANLIGAYRLKCELEDICLSYLKPEIYEDIKLKMEDINKNYEKCLKESIHEIENILKEYNIKYELRTKVINIYKVYKKLKKGYKLNEIHDLVNLKIILNNVDDCYKVLGLVHSIYPPVNNKFKDYIAVPKTNMYSSLHTTVFAPYDKLLQIQIKTKEMDEINTYGIATYWDKYKQLGSSKMQEELIKNYKFISTLTNLDKSIKSDKYFIKKIKNEIFDNSIYVYSPTGDIVELPEKSTPIDYAFTVSEYMGLHINKVFVNGDEVKLNYKLKNKDRIIIISNDISHPNETWISYSSTLLAKNKIKEYLQKN